MDDKLKCLNCGYVGTDFDGEVDCNGSEFWGSAVVERLIVNTTCPVCGAVDDYEEV